MTGEQILTAVSVIAAVVFGYLAFVRNKKKDDEQDGQDKGTMLSDIGYIKAGVDDIKAEQKEQRKTNMEVVSRLTAVEESAKQAHKRIDEIKAHIDE